MNTYLHTYIETIVRYALALLCLVIVGMPYHTDAQDAQIMSVTPPLFQLSIVPGNLWQSSVKVVNGNPYPLTVYAEVVNFEASGEAGQGKFLPLLGEEKDASTLGAWINIAPGPHVIQGEQSKEIPIFVEAPADAAPGGHYAAVLITTQPPENSPDRLAVRTSQAVTSLFFARVEGEVNEQGSIREFTTTHSFAQKPEAEFSLRFENKGNVHLQPKGNIIITNMWGTERGMIPINSQSHFGNVLPQSIRNFKFTWSSDYKVTDIGRYKAIVTLAFGESGVKSASATTYFWVIPIKTTLITLLIIGLCIAGIVWMIRAYVRRMLALAGVDMQQQKKSSIEARTETPSSALSTKKVSYRKVSAPIRDGVLDLRRRLDTAHESYDVLKTMGSFIVQYKIFFLSVGALIVMFIGLVIYIDRATIEDVDYTVIINEGDSEKKLDSSKIKEQIPQ
jgi:hypothetical protein